MSDPEWRPSQQIHRHAPTRSCHDGAGNPSIVGAVPQTIPVRESDECAAAADSATKKLKANTNPPHLIPSHRRRGFMIGWKDSLLWSGILDRARTSCPEVRG